MQKDQQVLETILKGFVRNPDSVKIDRTVDEMGVLLQVQLHSTDMGLVIGERGKNIGAIRMVMKLVGLANDARVNIRLDEPDRKNELPANEGTQSIQPLPA